MLSPKRLPSFHSLVRCASLAFSLSVLVWSAGCSKGGPNTAVTGKVTLNGSNVNGTVTFVGPDKKSVTAPITNGTYTIENPSKGENTILVKEMGSAGMPGAAPKDSFAPKVTDKDGALLKDKTAKIDPGVPPPAKYATEAGGLKYTVKGGKETHNLELTP
jgi:hypothetical protein